MGCQCIGVLIKNIVKPIWQNGVLMKMEEKKELDTMSGDIIDSLSKQIDEGNKKMTKCLDCNHSKKLHNFHFFGCVFLDEKNYVCGCQFYKQKKEIKK